MKTKIPVIDQFSDLDLSQYSDFIDFAEAHGLTIMKTAFEIRQETIEDYGPASQILIRINPDFCLGRTQKLIAFFIIELALSQHQNIRITRRTWLGGALRNFYTVRGLLNKNSHKMYADAYYQAALQSKDHC